MKAEFWHERWREDRLGFHQADYNTLMVAHFGRLGLAPGARVFVPLCGKTRDIAWLLGQGHRVVGAELSVLAVDQLFADLGLDPDVARTDSLTHYAAPGLDIFAGDIFDLESECLGPVDAIYDRAALVALPHDMRPDYGQHLHDLTGGAPQFLLCFDYDQTAMDGPPFSIDGEEVARIYGAHYTMTEVARTDVPGGLKGVVPAQEIAWHLRKPG